MNVRLRLFLGILLLLGADWIAAQPRQQEKPYRELVLTPQPFPRYTSAYSLGSYQVKGTTAFVDELIDLHLKGKLTLYRDYEMRVPYPRRAALQAFRDSVEQPSADGVQLIASQAPAGQREPEYDLSSPTYHRSRGVSRGRDMCANCLNMQSWWFMMFSREAVSMTYDNREELLSQIKQLWKLRAPLEEMTVLRPWAWQPDRYLVFTAEVLPGEERAQLQLRRGVLLAEYKLARQTAAESDLNLLVFDPQVEVKNQ